MGQPAAINFPQIPGYDCDAFLGAGATGEVYRARSGSRMVALKVLRRMAVNRNLIGYSLSRLHDLPLHPHVVEVVDFAMDGRPLYMVTSLHVRERGDGSWEGATLAGHFDQLEPALAWEMIRQISEGLAFLHQHGVLHCSLNPRNIMVAGTEAPELRLTDFGQGWVSDISHIEFSESFFYAPPEQLRQPQHMFEGQAQRWDVYAFGVTAYRLLYGQFPRGQSWIEGVEQGAHAFHPLAFAEVVLGEPTVYWPAAKDAFEERRYQLLNRCLSLNPDERNTDMREVLLAFREIERDEKWAATQDEAEFRERALTEQVARGRKRVGQWRTAALALFVGLLTSLIFNLSSESRLLAHRKEFSEFKSESARLLQEAEGREELASKKAARLKTNLTYAQSTADAFLSFLLNAQDPDSPEYQSVSGYLNSAKHHYERVLRATEGDRALVAESLRAQLGLARIERQLGNSEKAAAMLEGLLAKFEALPDAARHLPETQETLAAALLETGKSQMEAGRRTEALEKLEESVKLYNKQVNASPRMLPLRRKFGKALFFYGQLLARGGELTKALRSLQSAMQILESLAQSADAREEDEYYLARSQFEVGLIRLWENQGIEAFEAFQLASRGFSRLMDEKPHIPEYRFQLARCLYYLGELSFQEKGDEEDSRLARQSTRELLLLLLEKDEANRDYQFYLALVLADLAEMARDTGESKEASENLNQALTILSELHKKAPKDADVTFHLALTTAAQADLLLDAQQTEEALQQMAKAEALFDEIDGSGRKPSVPDHVYEFRRATLAGNRGHALEVDNQAAEASRCFARSQDILQDLAAERPNDSRIRHALEAIQARAGT